jgi:hypothetical protein
VVVVVVEEDDEEDEATIASNARNCCACSWSKCAAGGTMPAMLPADLTRR